MSNRSYPRVGGNSTGYTGYRKTCEICLKPNRKVIEIQVNWFRGDDELLNICDSCKKGKAEKELIDLCLKQKDSK